MTDTSQQNAQTEQTIKGRSVFLVETTPAGIAVQTALLTEDGKLLNAPAIFPDVEYAFTQVDELKRLISAHFSQAARLGAQVAAQQAQAAVANAAPAAEAAVANSEEAPTEPEPEPAPAIAHEEEAGTGRKTLESLKKFVYSGLSQVSKIAQPSSTATPAPENTPHVETTADLSAADQDTAAPSAPAKKPRSGGKKAKAAE
jgi:hypothetical protein